MRETGLNILLRMTHEITPFSISTEDEISSRPVQAKPVFCNNSVIQTINIIFIYIILAEGPGVARGKKKF